MSDENTQKFDINASITLSVSLTVTAEDMEEAKDMVNSMSDINIDEAGCLPDEVSVECVDIEECTSRAQTKWDAMSKIEQITFLKDKCGEDEDDAIDLVRIGDHVPCEEDMCKMETD
jgi:hypothetical protein